MPTTRVLMFASLTDLVGSDEVEIELAEATPVHRLVESLERSYPEMRKLQRSFRVAVNQEFVDDDFEVSPGDEVALIPPVSGGCP